MEFTNSDKLIDYKDVNNIAFDKKSKTITFY